MAGFWFIWISIGQRADKFEFSGMLETGNAQIWWLQRVVNLWEVSWSYPLVVDLPYDDQPVNLKQGYSGMGAWELDHVGDNPMTWNHLSVSGRQKNKPEYLSEFELAHELADRFQARYKHKRLNRQVRIERVTQGSLSVFQHKKAISAAQANDAKAREILKI